MTRGQVGKPWPNGGPIQHIFCHLTGDWAYCDVLA